MTPEVKPWEPVSFAWTRIDSTIISDPLVFPASDLCDVRFESGDQIKVFLANGQTIIVKAKEPNRA